MKSKISKDSYDKLSEEFKKEYVKNEGSDDYLLDVDGKDVGTLLRDKEQDKEDIAKIEREKRKLEKERDDLDKTIKELTVKEGESSKLNESWEKKHQTELDLKNNVINTQNEFIKKTLIEAETLKLASSISKSPALLMPHIEKRLTVDFDAEGGPAIKVLDVKGNLSASTIKDLESEMVANKDFSSVILASKASGGSTTINNIVPNNPGGLTNNNNNQETRLSSADPKQLVAHLSAVKSNENQE